MQNLAQRPTQSHSISSLDGLRAISILMVVSLHTLQRADADHSMSTVWYAVFNGAAGVFIFFVISGFLITSLLLKEAEKWGSIDLRGFYVRRAFRILPPLYLYIGVVIFVGLLGKLNVAAIDVFGSAFFFHNLVNGPTWSLEHLWSISVEEQFYLVWPSVLAFCLRKGGIAGRTKAAIFPATIIALSPLVRVLFRRFGGAIGRDVSVHFLNFDFIMYGCLVALLQNTPKFERVYRFLTQVWYLPPATMLICNTLGVVYQNYFNLTIGFTISGLAISMFMLWCTRNPDYFVGRLLNSWVLTKIGVLSYSIYLWQTLFLHHDNFRVFAFAPWLGQFPGNWVGFFVAGTASYYIIERPALRLRDKVMLQLSRSG